MKNAKNIKFEKSSDIFITTQTKIAEEKDSNLKVPELFNRTHLPKMKSSCGKNCYKYQN